MCLKSTSRNFINASKCTEPPSADMTWIRIPSVNKQFMNVDTLTCLGRRKSNGDRVRLWQCRNTMANWQDTKCIKNDNGIKIYWNVQNKSKRYLHLRHNDQYAIASTNGSDQLWDNAKTSPCDIVSGYNGMINNFVLLSRHINLSIQGVH